MFPVQGGSGQPGYWLGSSQGEGAAVRACPGKDGSAPAADAGPGGSRDWDASAQSGACGCPSGLSHAERLTKVCVPRKSGTIEPPSGSQVTSSLIEIFATSPSPPSLLRGAGRFQGGGRRARMLSARPGCQAPRLAPSLVL